MNEITIYGSSKISFEVDKAALAKAVEIKLRLLEEAAIVQKVGSEESQALAVSVMRSIKTLTSGVESSRKVIKQPILQASKECDAMASTFCKELDVEFSRIQVLASGWEEIKRKKREDEEAERQAALEKAAEERRKIEAEENRKIQAAEDKRQAELRRIEEETRKANEALAAAKGKKAKAEAEAARAEQEKAATLARMDAEFAAADARKLAHDAALARATADLEAAAKAAALPVVSNKTEGATTTAFWDFEITNIEELFRVCPHLVSIEGKRSEIKTAILGGKNPCPNGLRIFKVVKTRPT